ncbi:hypothetical protein D9M71_793690 [compost metagenome]
MADGSDACVAGGRAWAAVSRGRFFCRRWLGAIVGASGSSALRHFAGRVVRFWNDFCAHCHLAGFGGAGGGTGR